jgi:hypothetical protein
MIIQLINTRESMPSNNNKKKQHIQRRLSHLARPSRPPKTLQQNQLGWLLRSRPFTGSSRQEVATHSGTFPGQSRLPGHIIRPWSVRCGGREWRDAACGRRGFVSRAHCVRRRLEERDCCACRCGWKGEFAICFSYHCILRTSRADILR